MIKVFFITSEKDNYFGVNQVLFGLKKFLKGKCSIINPDNIYRFIKNTFIIMLIIILHKSNFYH